MKMAVWIASVAVLLAFAVSGQAVTQHQHHSLTILDTLGGGPADSPLFLMEAAAVNDRGQIAGWGVLRAASIVRSY